MTGLLAIGLGLLVIGSALAFWGYRPPKARPVRAHRRRSRPHSVSVLSILARCAAEAGSSLAVELEVSS